MLTPPGAQFSQAGDVDQTIALGGLQRTAFTFGLSLGKEKREHMRHTYFSQVVFSRMLVQMPHPAASMAGERTRPHPNQHCTGDMCTYVKQYHAPDVVLKMQLSRVRGATYRANDRVARHCPPQTTESFGRGSERVP